MATKISLRKANALQKNILDLMNSVEISTTVSINEFQNVEATVTRAAQELLQNDVRRSDLLMSYYTLRGLVSAANAACGINLRLGEMAYVDRRLTQLHALTQSSAVVGEAEVIFGRLEKIRTRPADSRASLYHRDEEVTTGVLSQEQVDNIRRVVSDLKKQKQKLSDEVLELNVRTEVELTPEVEVILQREGVI
jgi:hypothetical protein